MPILHQANGALCLHASAVATTHGVLAFVGPTGAGKSSLARAWCESSDVEQLADDVVVLYEEASGFEIHPLPFRSNVRPPIRDSLRHPDNSGSGGADPRPLARLYLLQSAEGEPQVVPIAADALPLLLRESGCFLLDDEDSRSAFFSATLDLLATVPVRQLLYPHRPEALRTTFEAIEADLSPREP